MASRNQVNPPPLRTISDFKSKLTGGGARANLFEVIAGDRTFDSWTVTVINDTDFAIRSAFENWMNTINKLSDNTGLVNPADYQADAFVFQLDRDGQSIRKYRFYDTFPTQVGPIELSYDAQGIQEFTVELQVQYIEILKGDSPVSGGENIS